MSHRFEWHAAKVTRIEAARVSVSPRDVKDLLDLYGVRDSEYYEALVALARSVSIRFFRRRWSSSSTARPPT
nr:helix-turn-helix domain-containing protein [uncultured Actinoplanes sp.]